MQILDGHNDTLTQIYSSKGKNKRDFLIKNSKGHIDLSRAKVGQMIGGFFSVFVPPKPSSPDSDFMHGMKLTKTGYRKKLDSAIDITYAKNFTNSVIDFLESVEKESKGELKVVKDYSSLEKNLEDDVMSAILHIEGAEVINKDLSNLEDFYNKGLRAIGITWSRPNVFGEGVPFIYPHTSDTGPGLTNAGKKLVKACSDMGIIIDVTHLNEKGFWDVMNLSSNPIIASHSNVYDLCPCTRSLTDKQIDAIGESRGVIGVNFEPGLLRKDGKPNPDCTSDLVIDHMRYIAERIGVDHVAFGSDFDGAMMPKDIRDVSDLQKIVAKLKGAGFDQESLEKICWRNWFRVIKKVWKN